MKKILPLLCILGSALNISQKAQSYYDVSFCSEQTFSQFIKKLEIRDNNRTLNAIFLASRVLQEKKIVYSDCNVLEYTNKYYFRKKINDFLKSSENIELSLNMNNNENRDFFLLLHKNFSQNINDDMNKRIIKRNFLEQRLSEVTHLLKIFAFYVTDIVNKKRLFFFPTDVYSEESYNVCEVEVVDGDKLSLIDHDTDHYFCDSKDYEEDSIIALLRSNDDDLPTIEREITKLKDILQEAGPFFGFMGDIEENYHKIDFIKDAVLHIKNNQLVTIDATPGRKKIFVPLEKGKVPAEEVYLKKIKQFCNDAHEEVYFLKARRDLLLLKRDLLLLKQENEGLLMLTPEEREKNKMLEVINESVDDFFQKAKDFSRLVVDTITNNEQENPQDPSLENVLRMEGNSLIFSKNGKNYLHFFEEIKKYQGQ